MRDFGIKILVCEIKAQKALLLRRHLVAICMVVMNYLHGVLATSAPALQCWLKLILNPPELHR
jgi:hypothetical protein